MSNLFAKESETKSWYNCMKTGICFKLVLNFSTDAYKLKHVLRGGNRCAKNQWMGFGTCQPITSIFFFFFWDVAHIYGHSGRELVQQQLLIRIRIMPIGPIVCWRTLLMSYFYNQIIFWRCNIKLQKRTRKTMLSLSI